MGSRGIVISADPVLTNEEVTEIVSRELQLWKQQKKVHKT